MASDQDILHNLARDYALAWCSGNPQEVAGFYTRDGQIAVNHGEAQTGHAAVAELARDLHATFPDLDMSCDMMRKAGDHAIFVWTFEGHHSETKNHVVMRGWEEWELGPDYKVLSSRIWFDPAEYQRQIDRPAG
ncbi:MULTISPECIES: nuclear transport factor 2 family protein [unclassified Ruegeria]|uniref:nuclear transport factor 2 family protein n=1 Tax=unclassified Ruegeria TaxID=2625375 RepID=UPI001488EB88|nr:nuclear transport factor 2 family protein [Ruegeria sp. HKCCD8929]